jgi:LIVCS family branched-chain amino acid:cation transporter
MKQSLNIKQILGLGFMLFALFLGAGNLIFPPLIGASAGVNVWQAAIGFIMSGVGLPLMGIMAICLIDGGFNAISKELPHKVIVILGSIVFLVIGIYAIPRTAIVSAEFSTTPIFGESLAIKITFLAVFYIIAWYLSIYPGKLLETIGQMITPLLILLLVILGVMPLVKPLASIAEIPQAEYKNIPVIQGFINGYLTMDALGALMFGVIVTANLKTHGITNTKYMFKYSLITGIIAAVGLTLVYISLFNLGAKSGIVPQEGTNGAQILSYYSHQVFGFWGDIGLAVVITLACLTTAVGVISGVSEYFSEFTDKLTYKTLVSILCVCCIFVTGLGLELIIKLFIPVLAVLYPVCIGLIILTLIRKWIINPVLTYRSVTLVIFLTSLIESLYHKGVIPVEYKPLVAKIFPWIEFSLSWLAFAAVTLIITMVVGKLNPPTSSDISE